MAENLTEDLVLEIITRLPLKKAVQCSSLNKNFHSQISTPQFAQKHALLSSSRSRATTIFHCSAANRKISSILDSPTAPTIQKSINLAGPVQILSSCNGVFLLCSISPVSRTHYVFNPLTGGIRPVHFPIDAHHRVGLAVDDPAKPSSSEFHFKLVEIALRTEPTAQRFLEFRVFAAAGGEMTVESTAGLPCRNFTPVKDLSLRPVFAHGCLHWLGDGATKTAVLDLENERPRMVKGPVVNANDCAGAHKWFGLAGGLVHFIYSLPEEIVVYSLSDKWRVAHTIRKPDMRNPTNLCLRNAIPTFFDGRRLFLRLGEGKKKGEIHVRDLARGMWKKSGVTVKTGADSSQVFVGYVPTLARVSDVYLCEMTAEQRRKPEVLAFIGLQRFFGDGGSMCT